MIEINKKKEAFTYDLRGMLHTTKEIDELSVPGGPTSSNKGAETSHPSSYIF